MTHSGNDIKEAIRSLVIAAGAARVGFAQATETDSADLTIINTWLADGRNGEMSYMERYPDIRRDPRLLLEGARTVICCAFDYRPSVRHPLFADYSLGLDYHDAIRARLTQAAEAICSQFGGHTRICVDTAPIRERYWAVTSGIGFIGLNGQLIVDGIGSKVFLAEILWTGEVIPDQPASDRRCLSCGACVKACPGKALDGRCGVDARRCLSYLTIEYRGDLPDGLMLDGRIYGCDICQDVCPHNQARDGRLKPIEEFTPSPKLMSLTADDILSMQPSDFNALFRHSAIKRTKLTGLRRNALRHIKQDKD